MTTEHRAFDLSDILSITTGRLVSSRGMTGIYDILAFLTKADIYTHQIPRAMSLVKPWILFQYPTLATIECSELLLELSSTADADKEKCIAAWIRSQKVTYGDTLPLVPMDTAGIFATPVADAIELVGSDKVIILEQDI